MQCRDQVVKNLHRRAVAFGFTHQQCDGFFLGSSALLWVPGSARGIFGLKSDLTNTFSTWARIKSLVGVSKNTTKAHHLPGPMTGGLVHDAGAWHTIHRLNQPKAATTNDPINTFAPLCRGLARLWRLAAVYGAGAAWRNGRQPP
jgi:hypothetical protein